MHRPVGLEEVHSGHVTMLWGRWGKVGEAVFHVLGAVISFAWLPKEEMVIFSGGINPPPSFRKLSIDLHRSMELSGLLTLAEILHVHNHI